MECVTLGYSNRLGGCWLQSQQLSNTLRQLGAIAGPVVDSVALQINRSRVRARIVGAHNLDRTTVTRAIFFNNNDTIMRLLPRSNARQTDHQHWECLSEHFILGDITTLSVSIWTGNGDTQPNT
jgi:hypothetical protein